MTQVTIIEERGLVAAPDQGIDSRWCVIGNSSTGSNGLSLLYGGTTPAITTYGQGDGIDATTHILSRTLIPGSFCKVPNTTAGSYQTIDLSLFLGTAVPAVSTVTLPNGSHDAWLRIGTGFTIGVTGGTLQWSLDGGINWSEETNVGTAKFYTLGYLGNSNARINFEPPAAQVTVLIAHANAIRTATLAHMPYVTSSTHGAADTTSDDAVQIAATTLATVVTLLPTLLAALILHFARGTTVHLTADVTTSLAAAGVAVAACTASGTAQDAITAAQLLEVALETHENGASTLSYHGLADNTNVVSAPAPTRGTMAAGDLIKVRTIGPKWTATDLYNAGATPPTGAFKSILASDTSYGLIYISGPVTAAEAATVSTALNVLNAAGKRPTVILHSRRQTVGETEEEWITAVKAEWADFADDRIVRCDGELHIIDPVSARRHLRSWAPALVSRAVSVSRSTQPGAPADQPLEGCYLTDALGNLIGHDEGPSGAAMGLDAARGATVKRGETTNTRGLVYVFHPYVLRPVDGRVFSLQVRRSLNAAELEAHEVSFASLGSKDLYEGTVLEETTRTAIGDMIAAPLKAKFAADFQNTNAANLVVVSPTFLSSNGNVTVYVTLNLKPYLYTDAIVLKFALQVV